MFPLNKDDTEYRALNIEGVDTQDFQGQELLTIEPSALEKLMKLPLLKLITIYARVTLNN